MKFPSFHNNRVCLFLLVVLIFSACKTEQSTEPNKVDEIISSVRETYAPDKRVALFDIQSEENSSGYILKGKQTFQKRWILLKKSWIPKI